MIRRYQPEEIRFLVHWNAEVYADMDEVEEGDGPHRRPHARPGRRHAPRRHAVEGRTVAEPSDPLHDVDFIHALISTYTIAPTTDWLHEPA